MFEPLRKSTKHSYTPAESRGVVIMGHRVVELETHHVGEAVWIAKGRVSEPLPSGRRLRAPIEMVATGATEQTAIESLRHQIEEMGLDEC